MEHCDVQRCSGARYQLVSAILSAGRVALCNSARFIAVYGLHRAIIDAINARKPPPLVDARERTCFVVSSELLVNECLGDQTYAAAEEQMGLEGLVALVGLQAVFP